MTDPATPPPGQPLSHSSPSDKTPANGLAIGGLIVGIIGVVLALVPCFGMIFGSLLGLVGLVLGIVAWVQTNKVPGGDLKMPKTATFVSAGAIVLALVANFIYGALFTSAANSVGQQVQQQMEQLEAEVEAASSRLEVVAEAQNGANALVAQARTAGVDGSTISSAKQAFDTEMNSISAANDIELEEARSRAEDALEELGDALAPAIEDAAE